jgi:hypothetical protein
MDGGLIIPKREKLIPGDMQSPDFFWLNLVGFVPIKTPLDGIFRLLYYYRCNYPQGTLFTMSLNQTLNQETSD